MKRLADIAALAIRGQRCGQVDRAVLDGRIRHLLGVPSVIRFTITVTNTGNYDAKSISVLSSGVTLASIAQLAPGESFTTMRDVQVNMVGKFRFDATLRNELDEATTFEGNIIQVQQAAPTSVPTQVPVTTPQPFDPAPPRCSCGVR